MVDDGGTTRVDLSDRVVAVTGAGRGLGRAHALLLAARGAAVVVNDLPPRAGGDGTGGGGPPTDATGPRGAGVVVSEIEAAGGRAVAHVGSVAEPGVATDLVATAVDAFGRLDGLVNNAGVAGGGSLVDLPVADFDGVLGVHLRGAFLATQAAFRVMAAQGHGRIVFTLSSAGMVGNDFDGVAYAAAKAGTYGLMRATAAEGAAVGVAANAISPYACTPSTADHLDPRLHRWLDPAYVSPVVAWLCSRDCDRTGHVYSVAAGGVCRVFVAVTEGIRTTDPAALSPEVVAAHADAVDDPQGGWYVPNSTNEDFHVVFGRDLRET